MLNPGIIDDAGGAAAIVQRLAVYGGLATVVGAWSFRTLVVSRASLDGVQAEAVERRLAGAGLIVSAALLLIAPWRIVTQAAVFASPGEAIGPYISRVIGTTWGRAAILGADGAMVAAVGFALVRIRSHWRRWGWAVVAPGALIACGAPSWMGHANASESLGALSLASDALHTLAACTWVGGVTFLTLLAAGGNPATPRLITAFRIPALTSAGILVATGIGNTLMRVSSWTAVPHSPYAALLALKLALVGVVAVIGYRNSKTAASVAASDLRAAQRSIAREASVMFAVLVVTAVLTGSAPPGE